MRTLTEPIRWKGKHDDMTARYGDYTLRAEQIDKGLFWWCAYFKGKIIADASILPNYKQSMFSAKKEAVKQVILHIRSERCK